MSTGGDLHAAHLLGHPTPLASLHLDGPRPGEVEPPQPPAPAGSQRRSTASNLVVRQIGGQLAVTRSRRAVSLAFNLSAATAIAYCDIARSLLE